MRKVALVVFGALAVSLLVAEPSVGRPYQVAECLQGNNAAPDAVWHRSENPSNFGIHSNCGNLAEGLSISHAGESDQGDRAYWGFEAPAGTTFSQIAWTYFLRTDNGVGAFYWPAPHPSQNFAVVGQGAGESWVQGNTTSIYFTMICGRSGGCPRTTVPILHVHHLWFTIDDPSPPTLTATGSLLTAGTKVGSHSLELGAEDLTGGGVARWVASLNGRAYREWEACDPLTVGASGPFMSFRPCPARSTRIVTVNTEDFAQGPNEFEVCALDVAGNQSQCVKRTVVVDNSCPGSGGPTQGHVLEAGIGSATRATRFARVRSTTPVVVSGAVRSAQGQAVSDATVCVFEKIDLPDASRELAAQVTTNASGRFATQLDPGPSRELEVVYRYDNVVATDRATVASLVTPSFRVAARELRTGQNARFYGFVPGPNQAGRAVSLQARVGRKWRTFKQLRTDANGRFTGIYRFTQTSGLARFSFRALIKRQGGYPYEPGASKIRTILVRGG